MSKYRRNGHDVDEDEALDERGILKDGYAVSTSMFAMDAVQRSVAHARVTDGSGDPSGLHRPGPRVIADAAMRDAKQAAYDEYRRDIENAWRGDAKETWGEVGDQCTVREGGRDEGSPGHLRRVGNRLVCVPDKPTRRASDGLTLDALEAQHRQNMADVYAAYDARIREMWRNP
jgi:hypothetical protein